MKIDKFDVRFTFHQSGKISAVIYESGVVADGICPGYDFGKVSAAAVRAVKFYLAQDKGSGK